jgi:hypothetical protein
MNDQGPRKHRVTEPLPGDTAALEFQDFSGPVLLCPACREPYTHQGSVTVFGRAGEDTPTRAITVTPGAETAHIVESRQAEQTNPSGRRDGVAIRFWCEQCPAVSELLIHQHKGFTYIRWRAAGRSIDLPWQDHETWTAAGP